MEIIHNLKELNELGRDLKYGDIIYFTITQNGIIKYEAHSNYLFCVNNPNSHIFKYLGLSTTKKYELAERFYGYKPQENMEYRGNWPHYAKDDFAALERLIREIYKMLGEKDTQQEYTEPITNRFEILDL